MTDVRLQITEALKSLIHRQRGREFQWLAVHLAKTKWPELEATHEQSDGGEDATAFFVGADGKRRTLACSLTGTLRKVREDAARQKERGVVLDVLVFATPVPVTNLEITEWCSAIRKEFGHDLHVIPGSELVTMLEQPANAWLCGRYLGLNINLTPEFADIEKRCIAAAQATLAAWESEYGLTPTTCIELTLERRTETEPVPITLAELSNYLVERGGRILIIGPPGAGKNTTLVQLAELLINAPAVPIPLLVSLPGWAASGADFASYFEQRLERLGVEPDSLRKLLDAGRVAILLNGWNEVPEVVGSQKAGAQLRDFVLANPKASFVISTRETHVAPPVGSLMHVSINPLSKEQQMLVIKQSGLINPSILVQHLEKNPVVGEVVQTPLFLAVMIDLTRRGASLPTTRGGILKGFVEGVETSAEHAAALHEAPCRGFHRPYLGQIAAEMTRAGVTSITHEQVLLPVGRCSKALMADGFLPAMPHASEVVDLLIKHHLLVFSPSSGETYRFPHQQFQEWFAAESLYRGVAEITENDAAQKIFAFQRDILNHIGWFEPLSFLLSRLAEGSQQEADIAAKIISWAMPVDLFHAARLTGVAGARVWPLVRKELSTTLRQWYGRESWHHQYCALGAMLATESGDFQDVLWPLLESNREDVRRRTYRAWRPFRLTSLGARWRARFDAWDAKFRLELIQENSWEPDAEYILLATELANADPSVEVRAACLDLLAHAGDHDQLMKIISAEGFATWTNDVLHRVIPILPKTFIQSIAPGLRTMLARSRELGTRNAVLEILQLIDAPDWIDLVKTEVENLFTMREPEKPVHWLNAAENRQGQPATSPYVEQYLKMLDPVASDWATDWVSRCLAKGKLWWEPFTAYLPRVQDGVLNQIIDAALSSELDLNALHQRARFLAASGKPAAAYAIVEEYFAAKRARVPNVERKFDRAEALRGGVHELPPEAIATVILRKADALTDFNALVELIDYLPSGGLAGISAQTKGSVRSLVTRLDQITPEQFQYAASLRAQLAELLGVVGNPADALVIERWVHDELNRQAAEDAENRRQWQEWEAGGRRGKLPGRGGRTIYWNAYQRALIRLNCPEAADVFHRLLGIPELVGEAAWGLVLFERQQRGETEDPLSGRIDYSKIPERQESWMASGKALGAVARTYADAIHGALEMFMQEAQQGQNTAMRSEIIKGAAALAALKDERAVLMLLKFSREKHTQWTIAQSFSRLAVSGVRLPGNEVAAALEPFIAEHAKEAWNSNNDCWYAVTWCLVAILFSDSPSIGVARIKQLPAGRLKSHNVRDVLRLLAASPAEEAALLLSELAGDAQIQQRYFYELSEALASSTSPSAHRRLITLLDELCNGTALPENSIHGIAKAAARVLQRNPGIMTEIKDRCRSANTTRQRHILSEVLREIATEDAAHAACDLLHDEFPTGGDIARLIETVAEGRVPVGTSNAFYTVSRSVTGLRQQLLHLAHTDVVRRTSAIELLAIIQRQRIEHGFPSDEALHPDIVTLQSHPSPWQLLA